MTTEKTFTITSEERLRIQDFLSSGEGEESVSYYYQKGYKMNCDVIVSQFYHFLNEKGVCVNEEEKAKQLLSDIIKKHVYAGRVSESDFENFVEKVQNVWEYYLNSFDGKCYKFIFSLNKEYKKYSAGTVMYAKGTTIVDVCNFAKKCKYVQAMVEELDGSLTCLNVPTTHFRIYQIA